MNPRLTMLTAGRVLRQIRADRRTIALMVVVPCVLLGLLAWVFDNTPVFDRIGPALLGVFPFVVMFIVTSVATLRERTSGTLERLMTTRTGKGDLLFGYGIAFGTAAAVQGSVAAACAYLLYGMQTAGSAALVVLVAVLTALLGVGLGLLYSAFARTEFQAVHLLPIVVIPQILFAGAIVPVTGTSAVIAKVFVAAYWAHDALKALLDPTVQRYVDPDAAAGGASWMKAVIMLPLHAAAYGAGALLCLARNDGPGGVAKALGAARESLAAGRRASSTS